MKIFFIGTPRGDLDMGRAIYDSIEQLGHSHISSFMKELDLKSFYKVDESEWEKRYLARLKEISGAEVCVFEVSKHSLAVGQLVQEAISSEKPTILLYMEGKKPHFFRGTDLAEKRVQLLAYDKNDINQVLKDGLEIAKELLTTRFTMLMPAELLSFLDSEKDDSGLNRSEYIRGLINREMEKKS